MRVVSCIPALLTGCQAIKRRLRKVEVPVAHDIGHFLEKERHEQRGDVCAVDVGIGHDDDAVVP